MNIFVGNLSRDVTEEDLREAFSAFGQVSKAYLIGVASDEFAKALDGQVSYEKCETLARAVQAAARDAALSDKSDPVVLLSPACASFDQYKNFEVRGDAFIEIVSRLPGVVMAQGGTN